MNIKVNLSCVPFDYHYPLPNSSDQISDRKYRHSISLSNTTKELYTFKVQGTHLKYFKVRPNLGILQPHQTLQLLIQLSPETIKKTTHQLNCKFLIRSTKIDDPQVNLKTLWQTTSPNPIAEEYITCRIFVYASEEYQVVNDELKLLLRKNYSRNPKNRLKVEELQYLKHTKLQIGSRYWKAWMHQVKAIPPRSSPMLSLTTLDLCVSQLQTALSSAATGSKATRQLAQDPAALAIQPTLERTILTLEQFQLVGNTALEMLSHEIINRLQKTPEGLDEAENDEEEEEADEVEAQEE